jgi:hypothetical protein
MRDGNGRLGHVLLRLPTNNVSMNQTKHSIGNLIIAIVPSKQATSSMTVTRRSFRMGLTRTRLHLAIYFCVHRGSLHQNTARWQAL